MPLLQNDSGNPTISELEDAFSVEAVTQQFYLDYKGLFEKLTKELDHILEKDTKIKQEFETKSIDTANFAKKLLARLYEIRQFCQGYLASISNETTIMH